MMLRKTTLLRWDRLICLSLAALVCVACGLNPQPEPPVEEIASSGGRGGSGINEDSVGGAGGSGVTGVGGASDGGSGASGNGGSSFDMDAGVPSPDAGDADPSAFMDGGEGGAVPDPGDAGDASDDAERDGPTDGELSL